MQAPGTCQVSPKVQPNNAMKRHAKWCTREQNHTKLQSLAYQAHFKPILQSKGFLCSVAMVGKIKSTQPSHSCSFRRCVLPPPTARARSQANCSMRRGVSETIGKWSCMLSDPAVQAALELIWRVRAWLQLHVFFLWDQCGFAHQFGTIVTPIT